MTYIQLIFIDGASRENGTPHARSAVGIFFGKGSRFKISRSSSLEDPSHTNQKAELEACKLALDTWDI